VLLHGGTLIQVVSKELACLRIALEFRFVQVGMIRDSKLGN